MINDIITKLKDGKHHYFTVACSMYEETYWYEDGEFYKTMENGYNEPKAEKTNEAFVRKMISRALVDPDHYDGFFDFE